MELAVFALLLALIENFHPASTELQSLLIFTTARADDHQFEELRAKWSKLGTFDSEFSGIINAGVDQQNFWTILLSRGEPDVLYGDIEKAIQADDRTKVIVGRPNGIIDRIFLSPFCWRRGATEQIAFVMCNGKLEFPIDDRGWEIDEKVEVNGAMRTGAEAMMAQRSVWIDLLPGVKMATASPLQKQTDEQQSKKRVQKHKIPSKSAEDEEEEEKVRETEEKPIEEKMKDEHKMNEDDKNAEIGVEAKEEQVEDDEPKHEDKVLNDLPEFEQKRLCKYRLSCYTQKGIALSEKQLEKHNGGVLSQKMAPPKLEKKSTMKDAADLAVKKMQQKEAVGKALRAKYESDGDKVLADFWSELERKNKCKYRKSCYRTGTLPRIEPNPIAAWLGRSMSKNEDDAVEEDEAVQKNFEDMDDYEKKLHCRYRRSCYEDGNRAKFEPVVPSWNDALLRVKVWWSQLAEKQRERKDKDRSDVRDGKDPYLTKLSCKYRRSCYETGELPQHLRGPKKEAVEETPKVLGGKKVPTSVKELKLFCKYRKSCYLASAAAKVDRMEDEGIPIQNVTEKKAASEEIRKPKPNSDSHANLEVPVPVQVLNGEKEEEKVEEEREEPKVEDEKEISKEEDVKSKEEVQAVPPVPVAKIAVEKRRTIRQNFAKTGRGMKPQKEVLKVEKQQPKEEKKQKERKHKKYVPENVPVPIAVEKEEPKVEIEKKPEEKQKERKHKKYTVEEAPKPEESAKVWAKRNPKTVGRSKMSKLECRYRKSCYESGIVPDSIPEKEDEAGIGIWPILVGSNDEKSSEDGQDKDIQGWARMSEKERWFRCKYRKSCYERMSAQHGAPKQQQQQPKTEFKHHRKPLDAQKPKPDAPLQIPLKTKLQCKYRKSCYESGNVKMPMVLERSEQIGRLRNWTTTGGERCNPWRISCRQALGLPIREKAPIGPSGRKLCRRRKDDDSKK